MEQLNELEKRVLDVVQKSKELIKENSKIKSEKIRLQEQCKQLEASLMKASKGTKTLEKEKASIRTTIEELLSTINSLEQESKIDKFPVRSVDK
jgi:predicted nuclease with TOPRIM domain